MGECIESLYEDRSKFAGPLAFHFKEAHEPLKAAKYALISAQLEQSRYSFDEVEKWCKFGLKIVNELHSNKEIREIKLEILTELALSCLNSGNIEKAHKNYITLLDYSIQISAETQKIAQCYAYMGGLCDSLMRIDEGLKYIQQGKALLEEKNIPFSEPHICLALNEGLLYTRIGDNEKVVELLQDIILKSNDLRQTVPLQLSLIGVYNSLSAALGYLSRYKESISGYLKAIEIAKQNEDLRMEMIALIDMAADYIIIGRLKEAKIVVNKGMELAVKIGDLENQGYALATIGWLLLVQCQYTDSILALRKAIDIFEKIGSKWYLPYAYTDMALAYLRMSDLNISHKYAVKGNDSARNVKNAIGLNLDAIGQIEAAFKNWEKSAENFEAAIDIFKEMKRPCHIALSERNLAEMLLQKSDDKSKALKLLHKAMKTFKELNLTYEAEKTYSIIDGVRN